MMNVGEGKGVVRLDPDERRMQDIFAAYRLTGVTIFKEATPERHYRKSERDNGSDKRLTKSRLGIRFETSTLVCVEKQTGDRREKFKVYKHTIPHWLPLKDWERKYLNRDMITFVRKVSDHLQAFIRRREGLRQLRLGFSPATLAPPRPSPSSQPPEEEGKESSTDNSSEEKMMSTGIALRSKDAAVREIYLAVDRPHDLFFHYHRHLFERAEKGRETTSGSSHDPHFSSDSSTLFGSNVSKILDGYGSGSEDNISELSQSKLRDRLKYLEHYWIATIDIFYDDLLSPLPTRVKVRLIAQSTEGLTPEQELNLDNQTRRIESQWQKILLAEDSLSRALSKIALLPEQ
ncbi:hypothetical protein BGW41_003527 [Actinomortierella wolfii]|nr:hypothetical protein BGW41_003527 [Actinomortierella wolfii]